MVVVAVASVRTCLPLLVHKVTLLLLGRSSGEAVGRRKKGKTVKTFVNVTCLSEFTGVPPTLLFLTGNGFACLLR